MEQHISLRSKYGLFSLYGFLFVYFFCFQFYYAWPFTIDDAFITLRYAKHVSIGEGFVWNHDGIPIEGYSNFLYVVLEAGLFKLGLPVIQSLKFIALLMVAFSCYGLTLITRLWLPRIYAYLPGLILLMHPGQILWSVSGLETPLYQFLLIYSAYFILTQRAIAAGSMLALASMTRPEAPMLFLVFLACFAYQLYKGNRSYWEQAFKLTLSFSVVYGPYFLWRLLYFKQLFPNPVYCKAFSAPSAPFDLDISYLLLTLPLLIAAVPYFRKKAKFHDLYLILPSIAYLIALAHADWIVAFLDRHFLAAYALILPIFIKGVVELFKNKKLNLPRSWQTYCVILYSLLAGFLLTHRNYSLSAFHFTAQSAVKGNDLRANVGQWLEQHVPKNHQVSLGDCGLIPYLYDGHIIDSYCLNNLEFSKAPINYSYEKFAHWLIYTKQPENIILLAMINRDREFYPPSDYIVLHDKQFQKDYKKIQQAYFIQSNAPFFYGYKYEIYQRNDLKDQGTQKKIAL